LPVRLLEREAVLDSLTDYVADARGSDARVVLIAGEAGVGKTALLDALHERAPEVRWLWGGCDGAFTPVPLGPLYDIAGQVGGALAEACRDDAPRERMFRALLEELTGAARVTALVIEDVHWADDATLDLLRFLARRLRTAKALVLVTYRDDGLAADHPLRRTLGELAPLRSTRRITVATLTRDGVSRLAGDRDLPDERLFELTGGNPFLVTEALAADPGELPQTVREAVLARVARLSGDARRVLEAAAVIGTRVEVDVLREAGGAATETIDECLTSGALVTDGAVFRFRHELARIAVVESLPAHRCAELHRRTLSALVAAGLSADDARLAHHAEGAHDAAAVLRHAPRAAARAAGLAAHREAAAQYERALRFAGEADVRLRAELHTALADEDALIDRWEQAAEHRQAALALWREVGDPLRVGDQLSRLSPVLWWLCRGEEAEAADLAAVDVLEPLRPSEGLARAYTHLAGMYSSSRPERTRPLARKGAALAEQLGATAILSAALNAEACAAFAMGEEAEAVLRRALDIALAGGHENQAGITYANLLLYAREEHRFAAAARWFDEGIAYAEEHDLGTYATALRGQHAYTLEKLGRWDDAQSLAGKVLATADPSPRNQLILLMIVARIRARRGHEDTGTTVDEVRSLLTGLGHAPLLVEAHLTAAEAAWLAGRSADAAAEVRTAIDSARQVGPWLRGAIASWARRLGVETDLSDLARPYQLEVAGDWRDAADAWLASGCPYDAALALLDADEDDALREATGLLDDLGATATLAVAQSVMRKRGIKAIPRGRRAATRADRFGLTRREREVLRLISTGMTNADIAARLFIAEKTVSQHVTAVLNKLDVSSRGAAARKATDEGLVGTAI
jgi:DNA-binding CsgD family transcriptional regulator/tetratricopeptide (TPR) repeat protein